MITRKEALKEYTWDLTPFFAKEEDFYKEVAEIEASLPTVAVFEGKIGESFDSFKNALDTYFAMMERIEKASVYAFMYFSQDGGDTEAQKVRATVHSATVKAMTVSAFFEPEILSISKETIDEYMKNDSVKVYTQYINDLQRGKLHTLDADKEKLLAPLGEVSGTASDIYDAFCEVDMTFPKIKDSKGNEIELSHGNFTACRESTDRVLRENAFNTFFGEYLKYNNTFSVMYSSHIKFDCYYSRVRGYKSALEAGLFGSNVPTSVYDSLCSAIRDSLPTMRKYIDLRTKALGKEKIDMFDLYTPMVEDVEYPMPYEDAKTLVKNALAPLGEEYAKLLDRAYSERWVDVYENKGKSTGAYSISAYGVHPYVLLNYSDTLDDAFTLAHELGHAMHSYYSNENQEYPNHDYRLTVAEVASTVNEVLLTLYLLKTETDKKRRAYILNHFLEGFRTTVYRQTLFAEFERKAHEMHESGIPLTAEALNNLYKELISTYYEGAEINDIMKVEWSFIPHFYRSYYVYQYATGFSSAVTIANNIVNTGDASNYLRFLSTGGSDYPLEELKIAGIDLTKPDTVASALSLFAKTVDELAEIL